MANTKKQSIRNYLTFPRVAASLVLGFLVFMGASHPLQAQTVTQGYDSDQKLQRGMIVQIKKNDSTKIEPVSQQTMDQMHGVVVDANDAPVTLSSEGQKQFIATTGHFDVLVSSQNGSISSGDYITVSAINGIGMRAGSSEPFVIGRALSSFDGKTGAIGSTEVKDSTGTKRSVTIGRVQVDIVVARNPLLKATQANLPEFLRRATESIAGKPVSPAKAYTAVVIFVISSIISASLMIGGVRSAIISIGRNPLSKKSIIRGMFQVIIVGITIFLCGIFGVYLLLKL